MRGSVTEQGATRAKQLLWQGELHEIVAQTVGCSRGFITLIATGRYWAGVTWPDGSTGALPHYRKLEIAESRRHNPRGRQAGLEVPYEPLPMPRPQTIQAQAEDTLTDSEKLQVMEQVRAAIEAEHEEDLLAAIRAVENETRPTVPPPPDYELEYDKYEWTDVLKMASTNKLVQLADITKDTTLQEAICIVFKVLPKSQWGEGHATANVYSVQEKLKNA